MGRHSCLAGISAERFWIAVAGAGLRPHYGRELRAGALVGVWALISAFIPGTPETQGSIAFKGMSNSGRAILTGDNPRTKAWRNRVRAAILDDDGNPKHRFEAAVHLEIEFVLPRPAGAPKKVDRPLSAHRAQCSDIDKLERAVLDAISDAKVKGRPVPGALRNDRQVVSVSKIKRYAKIGETPGCHIEIIDANQKERETA